MLEWKNIDEIVFSRWLNDNVLDSGEDSLPEDAFRVLHAGGLAEV